MKGGIVTVISIPYSSSSTQVETSVWNLRFRAWIRARGGVTAPRGPALAPPCPPAALIKFQQGHQASPCSSWLITVSVESLPAPHPRFLEGAFKSQGLASDPMYNSIPRSRTYVLCPLQPSLLCSGNKKSMLCLIWASDIFCCFIFKYS